MTGREGRREGERDAGNEGCREGERDGGRDGDIEGGRAGEKEERRQEETVRGKGSMSDRQSGKVRRTEGGTEGERVGGNPSRWDTRDRG